MRSIVQILRDQSGQFWSTFGGGLAQGVNHAVDLYQKKKQQDMAQKLQQAQLDELAAKTEERKQGQALRQRFTANEDLPSSYFETPDVTKQQTQKALEPYQAENIADENIGAQPTAEQLTGIKQNAQAVSGVQGKQQVQDSLLRQMYPDKYAAQKFRHDMPTSSTGRSINESLRFTDIKQAKAFVDANKDSFPFGADFGIDRDGYVRITGVRQALGSTAAIQQKHGPGGLLAYGQQEAATKAAASTEARLATEATAGREDIPPYQPPQTFTGNPQYSGTQQQPQAQPTRVPTGGRATGPSSFLYENPAAPQQAAPTTPTPSAEPRYYDPALPPEITGPLQQQGYQPAPPGYVGGGSPRQSQINPGQPAPQHVPPQTQPTPAQPGHVSPGMTPAPAKSTSTSLPAKDPKESWVAYNARVKATVTRQEGHMSQEEQNAVIGHTDALTAAHQLNSFTPEEIDAFTGIISTKTQGLNRFATEIPYVRAFSDPKMAQRFSQFQQLSAKINLGIFTLGGKQLTPYEGAVVKGFIPTGEETTTIEWREKMNGFEAFTRAARDIRAKLAASGRGNIPLDELDGIMRRELSGVYGMPQNSTDQYITDPASGATYRKTKEGALFRTK